MLFVKEKLTATATKTSPLRWVIYSKSLVKMLRDKECIYRCNRGFSRLSWIADLSGNAGSEYEKNGERVAGNCRHRRPVTFQAKVFNARSLMRSVTERVFLILGKNSFHLSRKSLSDERTSASRKTLASRERTLSFVIIFLLSNTVEKRRGGKKKIDILVYQ